MSLNKGTLAPDRADPGAVEATVTSVHAKSRRLRVIVLAIPQIPTLYWYYSCPSPPTISISS